MALIKRKPTYVLHRRIYRDRRSQIRFGRRDFVRNPICDWRLPGCDRLACAMPASSAGDGRPCPACGEVLAATTTDNTEVVVCRKCSHVSVSQRCLARLLEAASARVSKEVDPELQIAPLARLDKKAECPNCRHPMAIDDYCGARVNEELLKDAAAFVDATLMARALSPTCLVAGRSSAPAAGEFSVDENQRD